MVMWLRYLCTLSWFSHLVVALFSVIFVIGWPILAGNLLYYPLRYWFGFSKDFVVFSWIMFSAFGWGIWFWSFMSWVMWEPKEVRDGEYSWQSKKLPKNLSTYYHHIRKKIDMFFDGYRNFIDQKETHSRD